MIFPMVGKSKEFLLKNAGKGSSGSDVHFVTVSVQRAVRPLLPAAGYRIGKYTLSWSMCDYSNPEGTTTFSVGVTMLRWRCWWPHYQRSSPVKDYRINHPFSWTDIKQMKKARSF